MEGLSAWWNAHSWLYTGSFSGSMVAMLMARNLRLLARMQSLVIGVLFGCAVGPLICEMWFSRFDPLVSRVPSAICFFTGMFALAVIPILMRKASGWLTKWNPSIPETPQ